MIADERSLLSLELSEEWGGLAWRKRIWSERFHSIFRSCFLVRD
jgi:hypothetical protein